VWFVWSGYPYDAHINSLLITQLIVCLYTRIPFARTKIEPGFVWSGYSYDAHINSLLITQLIVCLCTRIPFARTTLPKQVK